MAAALRESPTLAASSARDSRAGLGGLAGRVGDGLGGSVEEAGAGKAESGLYGLAGEWGSGLGGLAAGGGAGFRGSEAPAVRVHVHGESGLGEGGSVLVVATSYDGEGLGFRV